MLKLVKYTNKRKSMFKKVNYVNQKRNTFASNNNILLKPAFELEEKAPYKISSTLMSGKIPK